MKPLVINVTEHAPSVNFNATGSLEIKGRSITDDAEEFYKQLTGWIDKYGESPAETTTLNIHLDYFNTDSSRRLLDLFKRLEGIYRKGNQVVVNWIYDPGDTDMLEAGEDYRSIIRLPFNLVVKH